MSENIPAGYLRNARGGLDPESMVKPIDKLRDETVAEIVAKAKVLHDQLAEFKRSVFGSLAAFVSISAEQYEVLLGGEKGNLSLRSYDGHYRVERQVQDSLVFDERLQAAKALIDACITEWSADSRDEIKVLINDAFQVDKAGNVNTGRVLRLRQLAIRDEKWLRAMQAITDSLSVVGSRSYVRVYERVGDTDRYQAISLDLASL